MLIAVAVLWSLPADGFAHMTFKKEISKKYSEMKVTCNACHVKKKPKTQRNEFGKLFAKELKDKEITENFKSREGDERKAYEQEVMIPEFKKALEKVKKMKPKDSELTYDELIKAGKIPEITPKPEGNESSGDGI